MTPWLSAFLFVTFFAFFAFAFFPPAASPSVAKTCCEWVASHRATNNNDYVM
ncbi:membrane or secreted protein [Rhodopirellula maiorica SM1]|uniref:Membrane or secreted protein n=1 Tax=Rhodopirellula maiorica SM1 TaxID=1265738 RepID=M5RN68_9BACT|nr:membrane or secreted protein [Rhodopirellula maiorica SM1]